MRRITFLTAVLVALLSSGSVKAQVGVYIDVHAGTPYYAQPRRVVVVNPGPVYYQEQVYRNPDPVYRHPQRIYYNYNQQHEYYERLRERRREYYHRMHEAEEHGSYYREYGDRNRDHDDDRSW